MALRDEVRRALRAELTRRRAEPGELATMLGCARATERRLLHGGPASPELMERALEALDLVVRIDRG